MPLVAGVDSSTQACKVVVRDAESGALVRQGRAAHPVGTEVDPEHWWAALNEAAAAAGGIDDVSGIGVGGQQHGMVALTGEGHVVRPALLWNDTRSAPQAARLIAELGGPLAWAEATGLVPVASFTVTKLAWLAEHEPDHAEITSAVCLPHDWISWRLSGAGAGVGSVDSLATDRGDASGTGYFSAATGAYRMDLLELALGHSARVPRVLPPAGRAGVTRGPMSAGAVLSAGTGDNAAAALGLGAVPGDVIVSIGTSGVVSAVSEVPACDPSGTVAGFADATGRFLPLIATLNAARVLDATARILGVDHRHLSELALAAPAGSGGAVLVPYLDGERTPNRPDATGTIAGLTSRNTTPECVARAAVEGLLCGLADGIDALRAQGTQVNRVMLIGGGARSEALRQIAPCVFGVPVVVPAAGEYVADGAARQAAWALSGSGAAAEWPLAGVVTYHGDPQPGVRDRYREASDLTLTRFD